MNELPGDDRYEQPTNWAYVDQQIMENFGYTLDQCWELTLPDVLIHLKKLHPPIVEPDWFVKAWRDKKSTPRQRLEALREMTR